MNVRLISDRGTSIIYYISDYTGYNSYSTEEREQTPKMLAKTLKDLYKNGKYQEVLDQLTQKDNQGAFASLPEDEQIECLYYKSRSLEFLGQLEDALQVATAARANVVSLNDKTLTLALLIAQLYALWKLGRLDDALEPIKEGNSIIEALTAKERQTGIFSKS